jgi:hypothetical protein
MSVLTATALQCKLKQQNARGRLYVCGPCVKQALLQNQCVC